MALLVHPRFMPRRTGKHAQANRITVGSAATADLKAEFPKIALPIHPPFPPQEAKPVREIPSGADWQYEPKWDGFRCLAFRRGKQVLLQSKAGQPLGRYFPEVVSALTKLPQDRFVLDGEIVIFLGRHLSFDDLLMRIHPAASRILKLSESTPATMLCFDLLVDDTSRLLIEESLGNRRQHLEEFFARHDKKQSIRLSPCSRDQKQAEKWMRDHEGIGTDGVVAKLISEPYRSGERSAMVKVKRLRTVDCVVGGFRYAEKGGGIGSLLLGLYNDEGQLDHVGFTSSFQREQRVELKKVVEPLISPPGFTGRAPGGPSRWSTKRSSEWQPLKPKLVCEVQYDHFSGGRFRHGTKFLRWRPEKSPRQCGFDQVWPARK